MRDAVGVNQLHRPRGVRNRPLAVRCLPRVPAAAGQESARERAAPSFRVVGDDGACPRPLSFHPQLPHACPGGLARGAVGARACVEDDARGGLVPDRNEAGKGPGAAAAGELSAARVRVDGALDVVK